jgi:4-oxalocrotonate tautomerase family enzyme
MPVANLNILKGHPRENLKQWIRDASAAMCRVLEAPADRLEVWVTEIDPDLWGISGEPASEAFDHTPRQQAEMPFIKMVLMRGRPVEQYHQIIAELTRITAKNLQIDAAKVRVFIAEANPDGWGIGGIPASVKRATELKARMA